MIPDKNFRTHRYCPAAGYLLLLLFVLCTNTAQSQTPAQLEGTVVSLAAKLPLPNTSVKLKQNGAATLTDTRGRFTLPAAPENDTLVVSHVGFKEEKIPVGPFTNGRIEIVLTEDIQVLNEVVATGYQVIPKERTTGSFAHLDNELLSRRVGPNILDRLEDVTPGLIFNRNEGSALNPVSIRGQSTLFGNAKPLVIIDNMPYDGDLNTLNPNDVESITVLKDAAAASIWGARAGNGVIVITLKKGSYRQPVRVSLNSNIQWGEKPDLYYRPQMSVTDFISLERQLFENGYYTGVEQSLNKQPLTPVVETLIAQRDGLLSAEEAEQQISGYKSHDVRRDFKKYLYRKSINQQYAASLNGGTENHQFALSAGYDRNRGNLNGNERHRTTFNFTNTLSAWRKKAEFGFGLYYSESRDNQNGLDPTSIAMSSINGTAPLYPYARLADDGGRPLPVAIDYRTGFTQEAEKEGLLNWAYKPLEELKIADKVSSLTDYRLNTSFLYKLTPFLNFNLMYQFGKSASRFRDFQGLESYYTRNLVNRLTQVRSDGMLSFPVPRGGVLDQTFGSTINQNLRTQLAFDKSWAGKNQLIVIAGFEARDFHSTTHSYRLYGFNNENYTSQKVDYISTFASYVNPNSTNNTIPNYESQQALTDHYLSYYANLSYTLLSRLTFTGSARLDQSNLFGVKTNQKGVPLWSAGIGWILSRESFFKVSALPYLKLRATYGYNGNINKSVSSYTTARYSSGVDPQNRLPYATIINPPNPLLKWERVQVFNLGLDFESFGGRMSGSIEIYHKNGKDLIGNISLAPSTGMETFVGNTAGIKGRGMDVVLNTHNLKGQFNWHTAFYWSRASEKVIDYPVKTTPSIYVASGSGGGTYPLEGRPLYAFYSYGWAGLDPENGDPLGYLDGAVSNKYADIISGTTIETMKYSGPARPTGFGALRNTLQWKMLSISVNVSYRTGYVFRRPSVNYTSVLRGEGGHGDYALRWQKPGDELHTQIPSAPPAIVGRRDNFYLFSEVLVERGDHIRLQDAQLSCNLPASKWLPTAKTQLYFYANNLGLLWKSNSKGIDPDYISLRPPRTLSVGLKLDF